MPVILKVMIGLLVAPAGALAVTAAVYAALWVAGTREHEGRRGLLAGVFGIVPGLVLGFCTGYWAAGLPRELAIGALLVDLVISLAGSAGGFLVGIIVGTRWAESRGVSNYAGERAAWGMYHVAFPTATVMGAAVFILLQTFRT